MAKLLRDYMEKRTHENWASKTNLLFASRNGKPLHQSSVLRRKLHPVLAELGQPKCGVHAFRRFRNTYLRNFTATPPGLLQFWMGHAGEGMSDLYDKIKRSNRTWRFAKKWQRRRAWASNFRPKSSLLDGMDGNSNLRAIWK
jgi:integrase